MKPVIVLGGGGHAKVVVEALLLNGQNVIGFTDPNQRPSILGVPWLGNDRSLEKFAKEGILLANGLGSGGDNTIRKQLFNDCKSKGYSFAHVIHPSAILSSTLILEEGVQIMAGSVIQAGVKIGSNTIVNTRSTVDHDTAIGRHVHIAPGAILAGSVKVEEDVQVGAGAVVIQGLIIGKGSIVGAGAVVVKNVDEAVKVAGVPARCM